MTLSLTWIANAVDCPLHHAPANGDAVVTGAAIDSRRVRPGDLFVALPGEHADGHDFVADAMHRGAVGALVGRRLDVDAPQIVCPDVARALTEAATRWRARLAPVVIGITGSCGKTTVKELAAAIMREVDECLVTEGNYNNELGLPLTLLGLTERHRFAVIEMGASERGDIAYLADIARPDIGLVTNASAAHVERFGSLDTIAKTKGEMFAALGPSGTVVINADDDFAPLWRELSGGRPRLEFSVSDDSADFHGKRSGDEVVIRTPAGRLHCALPLPGEHNLANALAACAVAHAAGATTAQMASGLARVALPRGRLTPHAMKGGWQLIDDSYNANPASLRAAIQVLVARPGEGWLVLGDMAELGEDASALHFSGGREARDQGVSRLFTLGPLSAHAAQAFGDGASRHDSHEAVTRAIRADLHPRLTVLVKGSRSAGMERVVDALLADPGTREEAA